MSFLTKETPSFSSVSRDETCLKYKWNCQGARLSGGPFTVQLSLHFTLKYVKWSGFHRKIEGQAILRSRSSVVAIPGCVCLDSKFQNPGIANISGTRFCLPVSQYRELVIVKSFVYIRFQLFITILGIWLAKEFEVRRHTRTSFYPSLRGGCALIANSACRWIISRIKFMCARTHLSSKQYNMYG